MRWEQIEDEWTAMTRRIRADWREGPRSAATPRRARSPIAPAAGTPPDRGPAGIGTDPATLHPSC